MNMVTLMFHDIYDINEDESGYAGKGPALYKLSSKEFIKIIETLSSQNEVNYQYTFDDGGLSAYTIIAPLLEKHGLRGCFFVVTSKINRPGFLTAEQIVSLDRRGHIIGSHSHSHSRLTELSELEVRNEWLNSKRILEQILGHSISTVSIPNGYQSRNIINLAYEIGYSYIYTSFPQVRQIRNSVKDKPIGRFVVLRNTGASTLLRLKKIRYRFLLYLRYSLLSTLRCFLGPLYKKIRNYIIK